MALFTIAGNHVGYEDELDLPTAINFDGAYANLGSIRIPLRGLQLPLTVLLKLVNSTLIKLAEVCQYRFYWLSPILVSQILHSHHNYTVNYLDAGTPQQQGHRQLG